MTAGGARRWLNRVVAVVVVPIALVDISRSGSRGRRDAAQAAAARGIRVLGRLTGVRFELRGSPLPAGSGLRVMVANHSSPLDIAALLVTCPGVTFVAGADLYRVPLLAAAMRALGCVPVERRRGGGHLSLPGAAVTPGSSLVVFPEGGIPPAGHRRPWKRGAFAAALTHRAQVVPVAVHGSAAVLPPRSRLGIRPGTVTVELLPPVATAGLDLSDRHRVCALAEERVLAALGPADGGRAGLYRSGSA